MSAENEKALRLVCLSDELPSAKLRRSGAMLAVALRLFRRTFRLGRFLCRAAHAAFLLHGLFSGGLLCGSTFGHRVTIPFSRVARRSRSDGGTPASARMSC